MTTALDFLLSALAAWRLASLLVNEDGPFAMFARLRYRAGVRVVVQRSEDGGMTATKTAANTLAEGLTCVWCTSIWAAAILSLPIAPVRWLRGLLAVSAGAIAAHEGVEWLRSR